MDEVLEGLWSRGEVKIRDSFWNDWEEDLFRSQLRFLPEPRPGEGLYWRRGDYWVQLRSKTRLVHPFVETLWVSPEGVWYQAVPRSLLQLRKKNPLRVLFSAK